MTAGRAAPGGGIESLASVRMSTCVIQVAIYDFVIYALTNAVGAGVAAAAFP